MSRYILALTLIVSTLCALSRDSGPYIGIGYGNSYLDASKPHESSYEESNTKNIYLGAYINRYLSVEFNYINAQGYDDATLNGYNFSTLAHYPFFNDRVDIYGRFGAGEIRYSLNDDAVADVIFGAGVSYRVSKQYSIKIAVDYHMFDATFNSQKAELYNTFLALEVQF